MCQICISIILNPLHNLLRKAQKFIGQESFNTTKELFCQKRRKKFMHIFQEN